jgi:cytochrome oxidase Cu insertion factor (SCO1/SenC/PrrC family)
MENSFKIKAVVGFVVITFGIGFAPNPSKAEYAQLNQTSLVNDTIKFFPTFELPDTSGKNISSEAIKSRFVMVEFWYRLCKPCIENVPHMKKVRDGFTHEQLEVVSINVRDKPDSLVKNMIRKFDAGFIYLFEGKNMRERIGVTRVPATFIYDNANKKVLFFMIGGKNYMSDTLIKVLNVHLKN